ncbi:aldehyde dehydrogenase family protein, partial [Aquicoccus sp. SCR17]|nr:aldehyde dehydrogenase family protein [Carideicomes alvinocaridis]
MYEAKLHIRGRNADAGDGQVFRRLSPLDGRVVTQAPAGGPRDALEAANGAAAAFALWRETPAEAKREVLARASALLRAREAEMITVAGDELGATPDWIRFNIEIAARVCAAAADVPERIAARRVESETDGIASTLSRRPVGVVLAIAPWNAAITLAVRAIVWPLICGNTVVFKGSELCPKLHSLVVECFSEAGLPDGAICSVIHGPDQAEPVVEALVAHPAVRRVNFTGSTRIGRRVAEIAAPHLKPCLLELSDKAPLIVLEDADLEAAAQAATYGAFFNQGQICMATERVIAVGDIAEPLVARMAELTGALAARRGGRGPGALISEAAAQR